MLASKSKREALIERREASRLYIITRGFGRERREASRLYIITRGFGRERREASRLYMITLICYPAYVTIVS